MWLSGSVLRVFQRVGLVCGCGLIYIGAYIITNTVLGVPYYKHSITGRKTLF